MKRSFGVTLNATLVLTGGALTLGFAALIGIYLLVAASRAQGLSVGEWYTALFSAYEAGIGCWGIASGIGLLRLREWARISTLVFGTILFCRSLPVFLVMRALRPSVIPQDVLPLVTRSANVFSTLAGFFLAGWLLYFFNRKAVRDQFQRARAPTARPLSITAIGWYALLSGAYSLIALAISLLHQPSARPSATILDFSLAWRGFSSSSVIDASRPLSKPLLDALLVGWRASLFLVAWGAAQIVAGIGLLKLKPWGRVLMIYVFLLAFADDLTILLPGVRAHLQERAISVLGQAPLQVSAAPGFALILDLANVLPFVAIPLWLVITRKQAFVRSPGISAPKEGFDAPAAGQ